MSTLLAALADPLVTALASPDEVDGLLERWVAAEAPRAGAATAEGTAAELAGSTTTAPLGV